MKADTCFSPTAISASSDKHPRHFRAALLAASSAAALLLAAAIPAQAGTVVTGLEPSVSNTTTITSLAIQSAQVMGSV
ncbi:MAG: hypothetical protein JOZ30_13800, partial [Hyphomicrobiales bacterium]|nr:hypothetical protein [Hyphomicrobiales bacterium]